MQLKFKNIEILAIGCGLPKDSFNIKDLLLNSGMDQRQTQRLIKSIGFENIRKLKDCYSALDLSINTLKYFIGKNKEYFNDIDAIIYVTQTPDYTVPANNYILQNALNLDSNVFLLDSIQGCSGFVHALLQASIMLNTKQFKKVLIVCSDALTPPEDVTQKGNMAIFGEGAGFAIVQNSTQDNDIFFTYRSDGDQYEAIINYHSGVKESRLNQRFADGELLNGEALANYVLGDGGLKEIKALLEFSNVKIEDLSYAICHQANKSFLLMLSSLLNTTEDKIPFLARNTGNTSSASIPIAISENQATLIFDKPCILSAFGTGLSSYSCLTSLSSTKIFEPFYLD